MSPISRLQQLASSTPLIRGADAKAAGVSRTALSRLTRAGVLERLNRGLYRITGETGAEYGHPDLVEAAVRVPKGVIVLLSALNFHGIGTHSAWEVWIQLPANYPAPRVAHPPLRIIRSRTSEAFSEGVETHRIAGHAVRITDLDRTIVDCFKHRNTVTLEVCIEALRERLRNRRHDLQALQRYARIFRVSRVMQPYLEALA
jgi:predicted transcriptional regulator of viral defense system